MTKLETNFTIEWNEDNCVTIVKTLEALGYEIYENTKKHMESKGNITQYIKSWRYVVAQSGLLCGSTLTASIHFKSLEAFLSWHFEVEEEDKNLKDLKEKLEEHKKTLKDLEDQILKYKK